MSIGLVNFGRKTTSRNEYGRERNRDKEIAVAIAVLTNFVSKGTCISYGVIEHLYRTDRFPNSSLLLPASIGAVQLALCNAGPAIPGSFLRHRGPAVMLGGLICLSSRLGTSFVKSYAACLILEGFIYGTGASLMNEAALRLLADCHDIESTWPSLLATCGALGGGVFWSFMIQIFSASNGIAWVHRGLCITSVLFIAAACTLARHVHQKTCQPDSTGAGNSEQAREEENTEGTREEGNSEKKVSMLPDLWEITSLIAIFLLYTGTSVPVVFMTSFAIAHGLDSSLNGYIQVAFFLAASLGHFPIAAIERNVFRGHTWLLISVITGLTSTLFPFIFSTKVIFLYFALLGFLLGGVVARPPTAYVQCVVSKRFHWIGHLNLCAGCLMGPLITAVVVAKEDWVAGSYVCTGALLIGFIMLAVSSGLRPQANT